MLTYHKAAASYKKYSEFTADTSLKWSPAAPAVLAGRCSPASPDSRQSRRWREPRFTPSPRTRVTGVILKIIMQSHELYSEAASPRATRTPRGSATLAPGRTVSHLRFPSAPGTQPRPLRLRGRTGMRLAGPAPGLPGRETDSARTEWVPEEARGCPGGASSAGTPRARGTPAPALGGAAPAGRGRGRAGRRGESAGHSPVAAPRPRGGGRNRVRSFRSAPPGPPGA